MPALDNAVNSLLLQAPDTGLATPPVLDAWQFNGPNITQQQGISSSASLAGYKFVATGDADADQTYDLLLQKSLGNGLYELSIGFMNSDNTLREPRSIVFNTGGATAVNLLDTWQIKRFADFDGDAKADILFQLAQTNTFALWKMDGATAAAPTILTIDGPNLQELFATGDFNGNGTLDLLLRDSVSGALTTRLLDQNLVPTGDSGPLTLNGTPYSLAADWQVLGVTDLNQTGSQSTDANDDIILTNRNTGQVVAWLMNGTSLQDWGFLGGGAPVTQGFDLVGIADFNGDRNGDMFWAQKVPNANGSKLLGVWLTEGTSLLPQSSLVQYAGAAYSLPANWQIINFKQLDGTPYLVDFDTNGKADVLVQNSATGQTFLWSMNGPTIDAAKSGFVQTADGNIPPIPSGYQPIGVLSAQLSQPGGLRGEYYNNIDFTDRVLTRIDPTVNFNWPDGTEQGVSSPAVGIPPDTFSVRWSGQVQPLYSEAYTFFTTTDDGVRLTVNGQVLIDRLVDQAATEWTGQITLEAGKKYDIVLEYFENAGDASAALSWSSASQAKQIIPQSQLFYKQLAGDIPPVNTFTLKDNATIFVNEAAGVATITAVRTGDTSSRGTLEYTTNELGGAGSATANVDYITPSFNGRANTGQIVFEAGEAEKSFTVPIVNDPLAEGNETFAIGIQNPTGGTLGAPRTVLVTIVDDDSPATISLSAAAASVAEGIGNVNLTVQRSGNVDSTATVNYATNNGTAIAGSDYAASTGTISFAAGQTSQTIAIPIIDDAAVENSETFSVTLSNPTGGASLGGQTTASITILDNDLALGNLTRQTAVSGLNQPIAIDWTPDGQYMLVAQKNGVVRVVDNGTLRSTSLIDLSSQVNDTRDRGLIGMAIHPNFPATPYIYLSYTYDPPEAYQNINPNTDLDDPDGSGNRPSRVVRVTVNPTTMVADPASLVVILGKNSTWQYTSQPDGNSTGNTGILPSGIVNGTTITAPANQIDIGTQDNDPDRAGTQNQNIRDYLATDSESHTVGAIHFGADGYLYVSNGDGTSYNFADSRAVRVQDVDNLSGKMLRIDPITGEGVASNPFYDGDPNSNQSKVFYSGIRNSFRFTFDPVTGLPVMGEVGWNSWEEINTGAPGSNFGWPYLEGPNRTGGYQDLSQAISFYNNGNINPGSPSNQAAVFPILERSHGAPDNATAIVVGDFYNANTLMFGDLNNGTLYAATLDANRNVTSVQVFDSGIAYVVDMEMGPDGKLYGVNLVSGQILRWDPA
jgi:glucose/arabinose dehydrogenase